MVRVHLALALSVALAGPALSQDTAPPRSILVLDGSGSMWGQVEGVNKIVIAREVIAELLAGLPPEQELGLMSYGHRRKGDCADIELLIPPGPDRAAVLAAVNAINPKGMTPLSEAVMQAAEVLRFEEEAATVILVSDGIETCEKDPCTVGRVLEAAGVDFTAHVVGFDLAAEPGAAEQLACLAEATGGLFRAAETAGELAAALAQVTAAPPAPVEAEAAEATLQAPEAAAVATSFAVDWTGPARPGDEIHLSRPDQIAGNYVDHAATESGTPVTLTMPGVEGAYELRYALAGRAVIATRPILAGPAEISLTAPAEAPAASRITIGWTGPGRANDYIAIAAPDAPDADHLRQVWLGQAGAEVSLQMPVFAGDYELRYVMAEDRSVQLRVPIRATEISASLSAPARVAAGATVEIGWSGPDSGDDFIALVAPDAPDGAKGSSAWVSLANPVRLTAPDTPGTYELRYTISGAMPRVLARVPLFVQ